MDKIKTVAAWMTERGLTIEQLLDQTALEKRVLDAILHGQYTPSPQQRQRIAEALGIHPADIAWGHTVPVEHLHGHGPQFGRTP
jgi:transcriptional regulator with XRE-family HTH domain